jgi:hypothetical protein
MAKKVTGQIKLQITAGRANPSPPIGPALGAAGVNIPLFLQGVQRPHPGSGGRWSDHSDHHHRLLRSFLQVCVEDPARRGPPQEGRRDQVRLW